MFSIYIPMRRGEPNVLLRSVGAEWALDPSVVAMATEVFIDGPDGGGGTLIHFDGHGSNRMAITQINLDAQEWQPAAPLGDLAGGRYWVGVWRDRKPGPDDLMRKDIVDGLALPLLDGAQWIIPMADELPCALRLNRETGGQEKRPATKYLPFIERTNAIFAHLTGPEFHGKVAELQTVCIPGGLAYAADALSINYRVGADLMDMLTPDGLIGDIEAVQISAIATGLELVATAGEKRSALFDAAESR